MAKVGSWAYEGRMEIQKSLDKAHAEEIDEAVEYDPRTGLYSDEDDYIYEDPYFELHTEAGPY